MVEVCHSSVCVAVTLYNPKSVNVEWLNSLAETGLGVYIHDNSECNSSYYDDIVNLRHDVFYYFNGVNDGVAKALNESCEHALKLNFKYILFLDQDSDFSVKSVIEHIENSRVFEVYNVAIISPNIICNYVDESSYVNKTNVECREWVITSGSLLSLSVYQAVGGFDENLFIDFVDIEYCKRLRKLGYKLMQFPKPIMSHELGSVGDVLGIKFYQHSPERNYYIFRNRLYLSKIYKESQFNVCLKSIKHVLRVVFIEKNKYEKINSILHAIIDFKKNNMGRRRSL